MYNRQDDKNDLTSNSNDIDENGGNVNNDERNDHDDLNAQDQLIGDEACASSSNRNFIGRQGSKDGRTLLMSPAMVAAAAIKGEVTDVRRI